MDVHKNARSLPASRALLYERVRKHGRPLPEAAAEIGLSEERAREWVRRADRGEPLVDRSSRPHRIRRTPTEVEKLIIRLRRERMTIRSIAGATGVSRATTARICGRHGLSRLTSIDPPPAPRRYERSRPGELVHIDVKKLGQFDGVGHRVTRSRSTGSPGLGWEFLHVATDDFSRLTYAEILSDERKATVTGFLTRSVRWFGKRGVAVTGIMTDNARTYRSIPFRDACRELQILHVRTRPYTPRTNGKVERMIQTLLREWAYRFVYRGSDERRRWLLPYLHFYNVHRRHSSLAYNPPISRLDRNNVLRRDS